MIEEIAIRDLGVIAESVLPLGSGFTALTGETGAGKTMVVTALGLLLGARADAQAVRSGSAQAWVEGRWLVDRQPAVVERVNDAGGSVDDDELILGRSVSSEGRSRAVVGGRSAPVTVLGELAEQLVVVHGQSDQVRLRSQTAQRDALDRYGGTELDTALSEYRDAFECWRQTEARLDELTSRRDEREREAADLRVALAEIEEAAPQPGEDVELAERAERLTNLEELRLAASESRELVSAEAADAADALGLIDTARRRLERAAEHDPQLAGVAEALQNAGYQVTDAAAELSSYLAGLDADGSHELASLQERRALLAALVRKYGPDLDDVIRRLETGSARLLELDNDSDTIDRLAAEVEHGRRRVEELAASLTDLRRDAADRMGTQVTAELGALAMPDAVFAVDVDTRDEYTHSGRDQVAFLLRPHPGADPRPLARSASGGELSRVMLAIEVVNAGRDPVPTFVFDEIDAGIGGAAAIEVGRRLAALAESAQVIVVTHLAQVAAFATNHLTVVKDSDGAVTASSVRQLAGDERMAEMARLLSGLPDSATGLEHARELVEMAQRAG